MSKKRFAGILIVLACLNWSGCVPKYLIQNGLPQIQPKPDKALCVVLNVEGNSDDFVPIYCDRNAVAGLDEISLATFDVDPGIHYISAEYGGECVYRINFQSNKVYYIKMSTLETPIYDGIKFSLIKKEIAEQFIELNQGTIKHLTINPEKPIEPYDADDFKDVVEEYTEWETENPDEAKEINDYNGYFIN